LQCAIKDDIAARRAFGAVSSLVQWLFFSEDKKPLHIKRFSKIVRLQLFLNSTGSATGMFPDLSHRYHESMRVNNSHCCWWWQIDGHRL